MKSVFHYCCKKTWIDFGLGSFYDPFCHCIVAIFFLKKCYNFLATMAKNSCSRTRASTVIPTKWCKTFEACTWTISEIDKNLPICYNIAVRYNNPENFSSLSCTD